VLALEVANAAYTSSDEHRTVVIERP